MATDTNGKAGKSGIAKPAVNGRAYPLTDHTFDVVVVGAGGIGGTVGTPKSGRVKWPVNQPATSKRRSRSGREYMNTRPR